MHFIDTHTHLYDEAFTCEAGFAEMDAAVGRATAAGVHEMILPDIDSKSRDMMFGLADRHRESLFPCLGLHPTSVDRNWKKEIGGMLGYSGKKIYAIGETGMDLYWSREFEEEQKEALWYQLGMACDMQLPVIIHSREATGQILGLLKKFGSKELKGVFHAFSGSYETFRELERLGDWFIGIGGVLTYKNASIAETVKRIPTERIILETDSPYLTPVPYRGKRNESSYIPFIAGKLAELKGTDIEQIAGITTSNAKELFGI